MTHLSSLECVTRTVKERKEPVFDLKGEAKKDLEGKKRKKKEPRKYFSS